MVWEIVFMLLILKIPVAYMCAVVWWAVRSEPQPGEPEASVPAVLQRDPPPRWSPRRQDRRRTPLRRPPRTPDGRLVARAQARR